MIRLLRWPVWLVLLVLGLAIVSGCSPRTPPAQLATTKVPKIEDETDEKEQKKAESPPTKAVTKSGDKTKSKEKSPPTTTKAADKIDPEEEKKAEAAALDDVNAEVVVLNVLQAIHPNAKQLQALIDLAPKTMQEAPPRKDIKTSPAFRRALVRLRDGLVHSDNEKVDSAHAALDEARKTEEPEFDEVQVTAAARQAAREFHRQLSPGQVVNYLASRMDFPDPGELLLEGLDQSRTLKDKEWQTFRDDLAYQVGWLVGGLDSRREEKTRASVTDLLDRSAKVPADKLKEERPKLEKEAETLIGALEPTDIIRNYMHRVLAETLSNHRLLAVIEMRKKALPELPPVPPPSKKEP